MAITVSLPISEPTNVNASLVSGGNLEANTTYYYVVFAYAELYVTPGAITRFGYHSPVSEEGSFTTTSTEKSAFITWTNPPEHTSSARYDILITKTSGDYTNSKSYNYNNYEQLSTKILSGTTGYTVTGEGTNTYMYHSVQSVNPLNGNLPKETGVLKVAFDGGEYSNSLTEIYNAIVDAGFSDYVKWDGATFILKGWFVCEGSNSGYLYFTQTDFIFIKGGVHNSNSNMYIQFGYFQNDYQKAYYPYGCKIDVQSGRYPFRSNVSEGIRFYGSFFSGAKTRIALEPENLNDIYYLRGGQLCIGYDIDGYQDSILGSSIRTYTSKVKDLKVSILNDFGTQPHYRLEIYSRNTLPYVAGGKFYACSFNDAVKQQSYQPASGNVYYSNFYNCKFPRCENNKQLIHYWRIYAPQTLTDGYAKYNYSLTIDVRDESGNPIENANISLKDNEGNNATWIEYEDTYDKDITGNEYTTDIITDSTGIISYYIESYTAYHDHNYPASGISNDNITESILIDKYPYTLTVSKEGYQTFSSVIDNFTSELSLVVVLKESKELAYTF